MLAVTLNDQLTPLLGALTVARIEAALKRAVYKTGKWVLTYTRREVVRGTRMPAFVLKPRLNVYRDRHGNLAAKMWMGLRPVKATTLAKGSPPKQTARGVRVRRHTFDKAFLLNIPGQGAVPFVRTGRGRWALKVPTVDWSVEGKDVFESVLPKAGERFQELARQELNYEIKKARGEVRSRAR